MTKGSIEVVMTESQWERRRKRKLIRKAKRIMETMLLILLALAPLWMFLWWLAFGY